jgi:hypothetical protein
VLVVAAVAWASLSAGVWLLMANPGLLADFGNGPPSSGSVGTNGVSIDLQGIDSTEDWEIVVDVDPGMTAGLEATLISVSANGGHPELPLVEITPGPPIEDGEPFLHRAGDGHHSVEWPFDLPAECRDGCRLVFPVQVAQLGEGPFAQMSWQATLHMDWEDSEAYASAVGEADVNFHTKVDIELRGPDHDA